MFCVNLTSVLYSWRTSFTASGVVSRLRSVSGANFKVSIIEHSMAALTLSIISLRVAADILILVVNDMIWLLGFLCLVLGMDTSSEGLGISGEDG
jgi:hypothetical protein